MVWRLLPVVVLVLVASACGGAGGPELTGVSPAVTDGPTPTASATPSPSAPPTPPADSPTPTATSTPSAAPTPTATPTPLECVAELPVRERLGQLLVALASQSDLVSATDLVASGELGGFALLGTPGPDLIGILGDLRRGAPFDLLVASDEEGGTVQRLDGLLGPLPSAASVAATLDPASAGDQAHSYGDRMLQLGVNVVFAPVLDVGSGPGIGTRSYSADPEVVADYAVEVAAGFVEAGVIPVLKHFPGHGRASADSHVTLPSAPPIDEIRAVDLVPYERALSELDPGDVGIMVAHLDVAGLSDGTPTSLSPASVDGLLRTELGFDGLVFTDALNMGAVASGGIVETTRLALVAGADVAIIDSVWSGPSLLDGLVAAVEAGTLPEAVIDDSVARVLAAKRQDPCAVVRGRRG